MNYQDELGNWGEIILEPSGDTLPVGAIAQFGGENAPTNWLFCNGQAVSRTDYAELFSVIGTIYGDGDGSTTFNVPDFSSRSPMGVGQGTDENGTTYETWLGQTYGEYAHQLTVDEMPVHNHAEKMGVYNPSGTGWWGIGYLGVGQGATPVTENVGNSDTNAGGGEAHNTVQPILGVNFIIKAKQSIGVVGTVSEDITDTNDNAVPTCETVKDYVDEKQTYSTTETVIGTWLGKPLYRKVIDFGNLPNNTTKTVNHYISNLDKVINIGGYCFDGSEIYYPIPLVYKGADGNYNVQVSVEPSVIRMSSSTNRSQYNAYVILEYTKTTD